VNAFSHHARFIETSLLLLVVSESNPPLAQPQGVKDVLNESKNTRGGGCFLFERAGLLNFLLLFPSERIGLRDSLVPEHLLVSTKAACTHHDACEGKKSSTSLPPLFPSVAEDFVTFQEVVVIAAKNAALGVAKALRAKQGETGREKHAREAGGDMGSREGGSAEL